ncbi:phage terminase small subunit P27 family [Peribacillus frigoritolerans]|nr:phage terminase small subunit P27 family [Peribacillus frigoritolerans]
MGRSPKPAHLHLLEGQKSHRSNAELDRRKEAEESLGFKDDAIKAPTWLRKDAKKYFTKLVKEFADTGLLKNVDVTSLALYADALLDYITFTEIIEEEGYMVEQTNKAGATNSNPHPLLSKKKQCFDQMMKISSEFGLSPVARTKLATNLQAEDKDDTGFGDRL